LGAHARERSDLEIAPSENANRIAASIWVVLARGEEDFGSLRRDERWHVLNPDGERVWTDDYSNVAQAWKK
jgi:hypothetical protein